MEQLDGIDRAADEVIEELRIANLALDEMERLRKEEEDSYREEIQKAQMKSSKLWLDLQTMTKEKCRYQREVNNLRRKLAALEEGE